MRIKPVLLSPAVTLLATALLTACGDAAKQDGPPLSEKSTQTAAQSETPDFIAPEAEPLSVGFAGQDPADIARYLLASGASRARLSPDGRSVAYISSVTGLRQMWVIETDGGQPRQLTYGNGVTFHRWLPDGSGLVYGADNNGNEQEAYYFITTDGSEEREILPVADGGFRVFGDFSGDGKTYAYASTERNGLDFDIYVTELKDGAKPRRVYDGKFGFFVEAISDDGEMIVMSETVGEDSDNLYLLDASTGARITLSAPEQRANHAGGNVIFSRDGQSLYFASSAGREFTALTRYDIGAEAFTTVFETGADVQEISLCGAGGNTLVWTSQTDGYSTLYAQDVKTGTRITTPALPKGTHRVSCAQGTSKVAISVYAYDTPGDIYIWDSETAEVSRLFASDLAGLSADRLIAPQSIRMPARDGVTLQGLLFLPDANSSKAGGPPPVVFDVHGGPSAQSGPTFDGPAQYLVDRGIAVFKPNVRGSTGFGRTYSALDDKKKRLDSVRDLVDMLDYLGNEGLVDTDNAAVLGGSYGGYAVNAVLAAYPGKFKAGVSLYGVADWVTALEIASPALKASDIIEYGDITKPEWREFYTKQSPIRQANQINVPVLFSHGAMDPRIDIAETEIMVRTLRNNGVEAQYIRFPDEGHGWRKLSNRLFYHRREAAFLEKHLLGKE